MNTHIRPAATVILIRESLDGFEIFMVKRSTRSAFGSLYVFPGGKIDAEDSSPAIYKHCEGLSDDQASSKLGLQSDGLAYWIACIRECFEEAGILLTNKHDALLQDLSKLDEYRQQLNSGELTFNDICLKHDLHLRANNIVPCAHWITPEIEPKRFDTRFFIAKVHAEQLGIHDGFELTESFWISPARALQKYHDGEMNMIMPTIKNLMKLNEFSSRDEAFNYFQHIEDGGIPAILPKFIKKDGEWIGFLPGEEGYEDA
ncbi:NUDIX domain-containing protein [Gammaproteobacteria bacterium]|nr:NUDIX domain-containing protein [Gammaproteobacteria bacterium]